MRVRVCVCGECIDKSDPVCPNGIGFGSQNRNISAARVTFEKIAPKWAAHLLKRTVFAETGSGRNSSLSKSEYLCRYTHISAILVANGFPILVILLQTAVFLRFGLGGHWSKSHRGVRTKCGAGVHAVVTLVQGKCRGHWSAPPPFLRGFASRRLLFLKTSQK